MNETILTHCSRRLKHFFHVVSNIRPIIWICMYVCAMPLFALIYWWLPDTQFRIPDQGSTDFGSWLYYSIVTITTLGFGDYTPAHAGAQAVTAIEVMCGVLFLGFFLNAVGAMKSEIDIETEYEKQRLVHEAGEKQKILKNIPILMHKLNRFLAYCYAATTPVKDRDPDRNEYNPDFTISDMQDIYYPSGLPFDMTNHSCVEGLLKCASALSLFLDSMQSRIDLTIWPDMMEDCFSFVATTQLFDASDNIIETPAKMLANSNKETMDQIRKQIAEQMSGYTRPDELADTTPLYPIVYLYNYIKESGATAQRLETEATRIANEIQQETIRE